MAGLPVLLREQSAEIVLPAVSRDFQVRVGRPGAQRPGQPSSCVLVLTRTADREIDELSLQLAADDIPLVRLDSDRCVGEDMCWEPLSGVLETSQGLFRPQVCWLRYFTGSSISMAFDGRLAAYVRDQWISWTRMQVASPPVSVINRGTWPGRPDRISQLLAAHAVGLRVPRTVVTSSPRTAVKRIDGRGDLIVKSLGEHFVEPTPGHLTGVFPRRLNRCQLISDGTVEPAPVLVQEFLPSSKELRIYAVGGRLICFEVTKDDVNSLWTDPQGVQIELAVTPSALRGPLSHLVGRWDLDVAAFDVLETPEGPVFLEVNGACDWLYCERRAGCDAVSQAVRELVLRRYPGRDHSTDE
jgi:hypothetical protein